MRQIFDLEEMKNAFSESQSVLLVRAVFTVVWHKQIMNSFIHQITKLVTQAKTGAFQGSSGQNM